MEDKNKLITWNSAYELGHAEIDKHHKGLADIINEIYSAFLDTIAHEKIGAIIDKLIDCSVSNFTVEEELFNNSAYPDKDLHIFTHQEFLKQLNEYKQKIDTGNQQITYDVMTFLKGWMTEHIMGTDSQFIPYIA